MSTDIRERLREAAQAPSGQLDTSEIYRRGIRGQRLRIAGLAMGLVLALGAASGAMLALVADDDPPIISTVGVQDELLADGSISWREYWLAVSALGACLEGRGVDAVSRFDQESGRFRFDAADTSDFDACAAEHLNEVEAVWWEQVGPDADGVSWLEYRTAVQDTVACINGTGASARAEFDLDGGMYSLSVFHPDGVEQASMRECSSDSGLARLELPWADKVGPSRSEDRAFYETVARCLRDRGHDVPDAAPSTLSKAIEAFPTDYSDCLDEALLQHGP